MDIRNRDNEPYGVAALRVFAALGAILFFLVAALLLSRNSQYGIDLISLGFTAIFVSPGVLCAYYSICGHRRRAGKRMGIALVSGGILGGASGIAGMIIPILLDPTTVQGPLVGIFITGPLGFLAGVILGLGSGEILSTKRPDENSRS